MTDLELIQKLGTIGGLAAIAWAMRPLWSAFAERIKPNGNAVEQRLRKLEVFKEGAETNHFHDIEELNADRREVWTAINATRKDLNAFQLSMEGRISRLEAKISNGTRQ